MTPELSSSGLPQDQIAALVAIYRDSAAKLRAIVLTPPGKTASAQQFNQARAAQQLHQVEQSIKDLRAKAADWIKAKGDLTRGPLFAVCKEARALADRQAAAVGVKPKDSPLAGSFSLVDRRSVEVFAREIQGRLNYAADRMGEKAAGVLRQTAQLKLSENDLDKILAGGLIAGKPVETIRTLRESLRAVHGDKVVITTKNGNPMEFDVGYYASLVVRTKSREATVHARHERLQELGLNLVAIVGRVSKNFCTAYLGRVFSLDGKSSKYPSISELPEGGPPFHVQCSKSSRPFVEALAETRQLKDAQGVDGSDKLIGVDAVTAQRRYKDLQIHQQIKDRYQTTADKLFGSGTKAA